MRVATCYQETCPVCDWRSRWVPHEDLAWEAWCSHVKRKHDNRFAEILERVLREWVEKRGLNAANDSEAV